MSEKVPHPRGDAPHAGSAEPVRALPMAGLTFVCSLGTGVLWNAIYFIAESEYGFTQDDTLLLAFVSGIFYTIVAVSAGWIVRSLERHMTPRSALALVLIAQAVIAPLVLVFPGVATLWITTVVMMSLGALQWPIVQHYLVSGRHGHAMRNSIGWFNASWMAATAIGLAAVGPLKAANLMSWAIPSLLPVNLIALLFLARFPSVPAVHDDLETARHVPPSYTPLLAASRVLHPMGYLVIGALAPILPYLFQSIGTDPALQAPLGSIWHVARFAAVIVLWRAAFWHGRGATLEADGAGTEAVLAIGLVGIGVGQGIIYYCAIYYGLAVGGAKVDAGGLAVGGAKVDAGGLHEALVGAGYFLGPLLGLATFSLGFGPPVFIGVVLGALTAGFVVSLIRAGRLKSQRTA